MIFNNIFIIFITVYFLIRFLLNVESLWVPYPHRESSMPKLEYFIHHLFCIFVQDIQILYFSLLPAAE